MSEVHLDRDQVFITGVAESPLGEVPDHNEFSMVAVAAREALAEAGLGLGDVDGIFTNYMGEMGSVQLGEYLGIEPRYADSTDIGGAAFGAHIHHAMLAVASGRCEVALVGYASRQRSRRLRDVDADWDAGYSFTSQFADPYGLPSPIGDYALIAARHMHEYGTTSEQLAEVAVAARAWAQHNPKAWRREPLTVGDVVGSRMIADPLHKLDCCLVTDGGGAVIVTDAAHARDAAVQPIRIVGAGESHSHWQLSQRRDITLSPGVVSGREAFGMAGIVPTDVDVFQPYDSFTITVLVALEDLGFCAKGEGGPFVDGGRLAPGGSLPSMTSGGGLSYCHPGALGLLLLVEAVRQLRGTTGERQVPDPEIAVTHAVGGIMSAAATAVLARESPTAP